MEKVPVRVLPFKTRKKELTLHDAEIILLKGEIEARLNNLIDLYGDEGLSIVHESLKQVLRESFGEG